MRIYIAGPMRGIAGFNFPAFHETAKAWRLAGHEVVSPAEHDEAGGFHFENATGHEDLSALGFSLKDALMWDLAQVAECDAICLIDGWSNSSGARAELALAAALGKDAVLGLPRMGNTFGAASALTAKWASA